MCCKWFKQDDCNFFSGRIFFRWFEKHSRPDDCTFLPVVIFSGCNWCSYFDTNTNYGTYNRKRILPEKKGTVIWPAFFWQVQITTRKNYDQKKRYRLVWAKKVSLAAICLVAGSASFGIQIN